MTQRLNKVCSFGSCDTVFPLGRRISFIQMLLVGKNNLDTAMSTNLIDGLSINPSNGSLSEPVANRNTCSSDMFPLLPPRKKWWIFKLWLPLLDKFSVDLIWRTFTKLTNFVKFCSCKILSNYTTSKTKESFPWLPRTCIVRITAIFRHHFFFSNIVRWQNRLNPSFYW